MLQEKKKKTNHVFSSSGQKRWGRKPKPACLDVLWGQMTENSDQHLLGEPHYNIQRVLGVNRLLGSNFTLRQGHVLLQFLWQRHIMIQISSLKKKRGKEGSRGGSSQVVPRTRGLWTPHSAIRSQTPSALQRIAWWPPGLSQRESSPVKKPKKKRKKIHPQEPLKQGLGRKREGKCCAG